MNPSRIYILRPVATSLLMVAILLAGLVGYRLLPVAALPEVEYPTIQVTTLYPGASPEVVASSITAPLERQLGQIAGLKQMSSTSSGAAAVITLQFSLEISIDVVQQEVQAAIDAADAFLPNDLPMPPVFSKVNPADAPIVTLAISSTALPLPRIADLVDTRLAQKISRVAGVGLVSLGGGQRPAVRIQANPQALAAQGLNLEDLRQAIGNANVNIAKGSFDGPLRASTLDANDQLRSADDYRRLIIAWKNGAPIRLGDVAELVDGAENERLAAWAGSAPAIILNIQRQPGANVIETVDRIKALLPQLRATLPQSVELQLLTDRTTTIRASVRDVGHELLLAIALVVMVIFVFLRNVPATLIPSVAVPLSLVGTFGVMYLAGFSINNLTLMALTIATGFVVDDAIVMIENIARYVEEGEQPLAAALKGAQQIGFTIVSLTVSLIAVLIPLLFMGDLVGRLFREFAITLAVAILISGAVSLTLTPMMCARLLRPVPEAPHGAFFRVSGALIDRLIALYARALGWVLRHQPLALAVALATLALTVVLYILVPKGFFPAQDTGLIQGITEAPQDISFSAMAQRQQAAVAALLEDPAVDSVSSVVGVDGINPTLNTGRLLINLKPMEGRDSAPAVIRRLQERLAPVTGITTYLQAVQDLSIESRVARTQYQFSLQGADQAELGHWAHLLQARLARLPELVDVASDWQDQGRQAYVEIDRDNAGRLGITTADIDNALYNAFGQRQISTIFTQSNLYRVVLEVKPEFQQGLDALNSLYLISASGAQVPLGAVARISERPALLAINHIGQFPAATFSFNLASGVALGQAVEAIRAAQAELQPPASLSLQFQGAAQAFQASLTSTVWLIVAAIITMYIVLGVLYESYIHPITILSTLPSAGVGALLALILAGSDLGIIGIILLIGIVKKNAIMMIDFALEAEREQGKTPLEAIHEACLLRFRPILMTTLAALLGALPLMLSSGAGAELRQPLGITMVGGLILSQILTLFTTPVIYLAFDRLGRRIEAVRLARRSAWRGGAPGAAERLMSLPATFIRRPVATVLLTLGLALLGVAAYFQLPTALLPQVEYPVISVRANLPGASPDTVAASVAMPLERALGSIAGVNEITSRSNLGSAEITLQFDLDRNIDAAARDVQAALSAARPQLPRGMSGNPSVRKANPNDSPVMIMALTSDTLSRTQIYDAAVTILAQKLAQVEGVGQVSAGGSSLPAVRVELNPLALARKGVRAEEVRSAIATHNLNRPKGSIEAGGRHWQIGANDQMASAADYQPLILSWRDGAALRLGDVAEVKDGAQELRNAALINGKPAVILFVNRQPGANIVATADRLQALLPTLKAALPPAIKLQITQDRSLTVRASLRDVSQCLAISVALVVMVVLLFLRDRRAAWIPAITVPAALIGTLAVMYVAGFSLNNLSLMALTVATGFLVDDVVVVVENTTRHLERGHSPGRATLAAIGEVGTTLVSISLALAAAFIPIVFLEGVVGRLFREFAVTLVAAIWVSLAVTLVTTPMLCARLLSPVATLREGPLARISGRLLARLQGGYRRSLGWTLDHGWLALAVLGAFVALNVQLHALIPKGLLPQQDTGRIIGFIQGDESSSFQVMQDKLAQIQAIVGQDPAVAVVSGSVGGGGPGGGGPGGGAFNSARIFVSLKPLAERGETANAVIARLRRPLAHITGAAVYLQSAQEIRIGGRSGSSDYLYTLQSDELETLRRWEPPIREALGQLPQLTDITTDRRDKGLQTHLTVDREAAARLGLTQREVETTLNNFFGERLVSTIYHPLNQYRVVMGAAPHFWRGPAILDEIVLVAPGGQQVPLSAIARWEPGNAPLTVNHQSQFAAATISFGLAPGVSLGEATQAIRDTMARLQVPPGLFGSFEGAAKAFQGAGSSQLLLILGAILAVYLVLGILYESLLHPLTILSTLPSAGVGALLALLAFGTEFTVVALIGVILLVGIVMKNAILLIDFALGAQRERGLSSREAIFEACLLRFRPIMMTTCATLLGALPLALGAGDGAELRQPLGITIVGGLILSQALTLYTTPAVFLILDRLRLGLARKASLASQPSHSPLNASTP